MEPYPISVGFPSKYRLPLSHLDRSTTQRNGEYYTETSYLLGSSDTRLREPYNADWLLRKQKPTVGVYDTSPRYAQFEGHGEIYGRERERISIGERRDLAANDIEGCPSMYRESSSSTRGTSAAFTRPSVGPFRDGCSSFTREAPFTVSREALLNLPRGTGIGEEHPIVREAPSFVSREAWMTTAEDKDLFMRKIPLVTCRDAAINPSQADTVRDKHPFVRQGSFAVCREASINLSQAATIGNGHPFMRGAPSFVSREASINLPWADIAGEGQLFIREGPSVVQREASINLPQAATAGDKLPFTREGPFFIGREELLNLPREATARAELPFMTEAPFVVSRGASVHLQREATLGGEHSLTGKAPFVTGREALINLPEEATSIPDNFHFSSPSVARFSGQDPGLHESVSTKLKKKYIDAWSIRDDRHSLLVNGGDYHSRSREMENNDNPSREQRMGSYTYDKYLEGKASRHTFNKVSASRMRTEDESAYMRGWQSETQAFGIRSSSRPKWDECNLQYDYDFAQRIEFEQGDYYHRHKLQKHNDLQRTTHNDANHDRKRLLDERPIKDDALPIHSERNEEPDLPEDSEEFKKRFQTAYLRFAKLLNENQGQKRRCLEQEKRGSLRCIVCGRFSKDFVDTHDLVLHAYNPKTFGRRAEHMGLHKALCILMGWNHVTPPDDTRSYQSLDSLEAMSNKEDLILWPPLVIVHNARIGKGKDGRWEGIGNPEMDELLKDIGFGSGKSKALYGRDGHQGIILIKFLPTFAGLQETERLQKYFEGHRRGRKDWLRVDSLRSSQQINDDDIDLVRIDEETKEKKRVLYGYVGISEDLDKVDFDTRKRVTIKSRKDIKF